MKNSLLESLLQHQIVAIIRGIEPQKIEDVTQALYDGGIRILEITYNQKEQDRHKITGEMIRAVKKRFGEQMLVGAGTVVSEADAKAAFEAGAAFALAPNTDIKVIRSIVNYGMEAVPGAMTPSEVLEAYHAGASVVKLFPAGNLGLSYCKAIMAPINHIPMIAVGGIDENNVSDYLEAGFIGAGIGSCLTDKKLIEQNQYDALRMHAEKFVKAIQKNE